MKILNTLICLRKDLNLLVNSILFNVKEYDSMD